MAELFTTLGQSTLASGYTAGDGVLHLVSAASLPPSGTFSVNVAGVIYTVSAVSGDDLSVTLEHGTDANVAAGTAVVEVQTARSLAALLGAPYFQDFTGVTSVTVTHNLGTKHVVVAVYDDSSPAEQIIPESVVLTDSNTVTVTFGVSSSGTVVVSGAAAGAPSTPYVDILSDNLPPSARGYAKGKQVSVASGATQTLLSYSAGAGYVDEIWIAIDSGDVTTACQGTVTLTVDGVVVYADDYDKFFGAWDFIESWGPATFSNRFMSNRGGQATRIPIPFYGSVSLTWKNNGSGAVNIWWQVAYRKGVSPDNFARTRKLHIASAGPTAKTQDQVFTAVDVAPGSKGRLLGVYFVIDSFVGSASPATSPLEGAVKIYLDDVLVYESSGTEDFCWMSGFFSRAPAGTNAGEYITLGAKDSQHWCFMRFFGPDSYVFESKLKITWNAGNSAISTFTGSVSARAITWYYTEA